MVDMTAYKERAVTMDYPSEVYFNLHKFCFSMKQDGLVVLHSDVVVLKDCIFKVSEAGRQRVLKEQRKNVHAKVLGYFQGAEAYDGDGFEDLYYLEGYRRAHYNPYETETFVDRDTGEPLYKASEVLLVNKKIFYKN